MFKKARLFLLLSLDKKLLFIEAVFYLGLTRLLLSIKPFEKVAASMGEHMSETAMGYEDKHLLSNINEAIRIMSRYTYWESKCLVQAIAAMKMLKRRHVASTLYLGVAKDENGHMLAHAWLRCGFDYITGYEVMNDFTVVSSFANHAVKGE